MIGINKATALVDVKLNHNETIFGKLNKNNSSNDQNVRENIYLHFQHKKTTLLF